MLDFAIIGDIDAWYSILSVLTARMAKPRKALVMGATGMLGHKAVQVLSKDFTVAGTARHAAEAYRSCAVPKKYRLYENVDPQRPDTVTRAIEEFQPDVVLNCIALTADKITDRNKAEAIRINSVFPHELADICGRRSIYFIHISSDAVFSGKNGPYCETDTPDPLDFYGYTKLLGEVDRPNSLTIRTSIFGRQLYGRNGLVEWLRSHRNGRIQGYTKALFSGLPTIVLCELIREITSGRADLRGIVHVAASPISKFDLLQRLNLAMNLGVSIEPVDSPIVDRRLTSDLFRRQSGLEIPGWPDLIAAFMADQERHNTDRI